MNDNDNEFKINIEETRSKIDVTKSQTYQTHANKSIREIPADDLRLLVQSFFRKAAVQMGKDSYDVESDAVDCTLEFIQKEFNYLPLSYVYTAFLNGSLGKYNTGRLVPKTIYGWMQAVAQDYSNNYRRNKYNFEELKSAQSNGLPIGEAIVRKIDLYTSGIIDDNAWDKIDIIEFARAIKNKTEKNFLNNLIGYEKV